MATKYQPVSTVEPRDDVVSGSEGATKSSLSEPQHSFYQTTPVTSQPGGLTANQMSHLAEFDELNMFRDGVFNCGDNLWPSCICAFCCPYVHLGQLAHRLQAMPCWVPPIVLFACLAVMLCFDRPYTEAMYFAAWSCTIFLVRHKVRKFFRPNPGLLGDFNRLPGHLDDCCLNLWCGCCAIAQLSRHVGNYKLHGSSCSRGGVGLQLHEDDDSLI